MRIQGAFALASEAIRFVFEGFLRYLFLLAFKIAAIFFFEKNNVNADEEESEI